MRYVTHVYKWPNSNKRTVYYDGDTTQRHIVEMPGDTSSGQAIERLNKVSMWHGLIPDTIAALQIAWERREQMFRMRQLYFTAAEIGIHWGVTTARAQQMLAKQREPFHQIAPVIRWMNLGYDVRSVVHKIENITTFSKFPTRPKLS